MKRNKIIIGLFLTCFSMAMCFHNAHAGDKISGIAWDELTKEEQQILGPLKDRWNNLPLERQKKLRKGARRWASMTPGERARAKDRLKRWKSLSPEQRELIRRRYARFRRLSPEQQERLLQARKRFKNLPLEKRLKLLKRWKEMSPEQRKRFQRYNAGGKKEAIRTIEEHVTRAKTKMDRGEAKLSQRLDKSVCTPM